MVKTVEHKEEFVSYLNDTFKDLSFVEESHEYTVGKTELIPTSNKIQKYYGKFPLHAASLTYAEKRGLNQQDVLDDWERNRNEAAERGTDVHDFAEHYILKDKKFLPEKEDPNYLMKMQVVKFWEEIPEYYTCISTEQRMYSILHGYAGTTDFLLLDHRTDTIVIGDYKTNKNVFKNYGNRMYSPFDDLIDSPYNHYQLQLSFYQILLEDIGMKVSNRVVVWIKRDGYELFHPEDYTEKLRKTISNDN